MMRRTLISIFLLVTTLCLAKGQNGDPCGYAYCQFGGTCLNESDYILCLCKPGYVGLYCDQKIELSSEEDPDYYDTSDPVDDGDSESVSDEDSNESESKETGDPDDDNSHSKEHKHSHDDDSHKHSHSHEDKSKHSKEHRHSHEDKSKHSKEHKHSHEDKNKDSHKSSHSHENPEVPIPNKHDLCEDICPKGRMCLKRGEMMSCECLPGFTGEDCSISNHDTKCQRERLVGLNPPGGRTDAFVPTCDDNGNYLPKQCSMGGCWCVDQWGGKTIPVGNSRLDFDFVCVETKCERERRENTIPNLADNYIPSCDKQGNYLPLQCTYGACWCVAVNGDEVSDLVWFGKPIKCDDVKKPQRVYITFKIQKHFFNIKFHLSEFKNVIREYIMKHTSMTSNFLDNIALSSGSILVDITLVEMNKGYRDLMAYSVMISEMVSKNEMVFEFQGQTYPVDNSTLTMDFDGELITCYGYGYGLDPFSSSKGKIRIVCLAAGGLILIAITLVSIGVYRRCRRNRFNNLHQVALRNDYLGGDFKKQTNLSFIQVPMNDDEKKVDLGREPGVVTA